MHSDSYLYVRFGFEQIATRFRNISETEKMRYAASLSDISLYNVTPEEFEDYKQFRKDNYEIDLVKKSIFQQVGVLIVNIVSFVVCVVAIMFFMKRGNDVFAFIFIFVALMNCAFFYLYFSSLENRWKTREKPIGVAYGYIVGASKKTEWCDGNEYTDYYSDIWIEADGSILCDLKQPRGQIRYAGSNYRWSELIYTPVKIFVFRRNRYEILPAFDKYW